MPIYHASVTVNNSTSHKFAPQLSYYISANNIEQAAKILEQEREMFFEGQPLQVLSIELMQGIWLTDTKEKL